MRPEEAAWIGRALAELPDAAVSTVMNVGSSTGHFRKVMQPHIDREIFAPLSARGATVIHCDMKQADGVDLVGDLLDPDFRARVEALRADVVLATNLFEHVRDRASLAVSLGVLPRENGRLIVSVPYRFPYHADPIDTLYRPTPEEIVALFPGFSIEHRAIIQTTSLWEDLESKLGTRRAAQDVARRLVRLLFPFVRPRAWRATLASLTSLRQKRSVSIVTLFRHQATGSVG